MQQNLASDQDLHQLLRNRGISWTSRNLGLSYNPVCILKKDPGLKQTNFTDLDEPIPAPLKRKEGSMRGGGVALIAMHQHFWGVGIGYSKKDGRLILLSIFYLLRWYGEIYRKSITEMFSL